MSNDVNNQDKKHAPPPKPDPNKKPVVNITNNIVGIGPPPNDDRNKNRQK